MGDLLFPMDGMHGIGQRTIVDEGIEEGFLSAGGSLLASISEDGEAEDLGSVEELGSVDSSSKESESDEASVVSSEVTEEDRDGECVAESEALSDYMLDESMDLL